MIFAPIIQQHSLRLDLVLIFQLAGDRQRPSCGTCADAGVACEINNVRLARGPKKGDLKALRSRIGALLPDSPVEMVLSR